MRFSVFSRIVDQVTDHLQNRFPLAVDVEELFGHGILGVVLHDLFKNFYGFCRVLHVIAVNLSDSSQNPCFGLRIRFFLQLKFEEEQNALEVARLAIDVAGMIQASRVLRVDDVRLLKRFHRVVAIFLEAPQGIAQGDKKAALFGGHAQNLVN